jgi:hypothetical protein
MELAMYRSLKYDVLDEMWERILRLSTIPPKMLRCVSRDRLFCPLAHETALTAPGVNRKSHTQEMCSAAFPCCSEERPRGSKRGLPAAEVGHVGFCAG